MKAILVIDMPKSCEDCPCTDYMDCYVTQKKLEINWKARKAFWCPLKPMPSKKQIEERWFSEDYSMGWNACIGELEK